MVTKDTCSTKVRIFQKKIDAWVHKELRDSQYRGCIVAYKENNVYNIYTKPRETKIEAMPLSGDSGSGGLPAGSEPVRPENPDPEVPGGARDPEVPRGAHEPVRDDVDGDDAMVLRMSNRPPEPSARQIAEFELRRDMHCAEAVVVIALRRRVERMRILPEKKESCLEIGIEYGFFGSDKEDVLPILCVKCRSSSAECMGATAVVRKGASGYASSFLTAFIHHEFGVQENSGEIRQ